MRGHWKIRVGVKSDNQSVADYPCLQGTDKM
jgi:hypothetical protein